MQIWELKPGDRFRVISYEEMELLKLTPGRALVRLTGRVERTITTRWGETATFSVPKTAFSISRRTDIEGMNDEK